MHPSSDKAFSELTVISCNGRTDKLTARVALRLRVYFTFGYLFNNNLTTLLSFFATKKLVPVCFSTPRRRHVSPLPGTRSGSEGTHSEVMVSQQFSHRATPSLFLTAATSRKSGKLEENIFLPDSSQSETCLSIILLQHYCHVKLTSAPIAAWKCNFQPLFGNYDRPTH